MSGEPAGAAAARPGQQGYAVDDVRAWVGQAAFARAAALVRGGAVALRAREPLAGADFAVSAEVRDGPQGPYRADFFFEGGALYGICGCEARFDCLHAAAVALACRAPGADAAELAPGAADGRWREAVRRVLEPGPPARRWGFQLVLRVVPSAGPAGPAGGGGADAGAACALEVMAGRLEGGYVVAAPWRLVFDRAPAATPEGLVLLALQRVAQARARLAGPPALAVRPVPANREAADREAADREAADREAADREAAWLPIPPASLGEVLGLLALAPALAMADGGPAHVHPHDALAPGFEMTRADGGVRLVPTLRTARGRAADDGWLRLAGQPADWALVDGRHFHPLEAAPIAGAIAVPAAEVAAFEREALPLLAVTGRLGGPDAPARMEVRPGAPVGLLRFEEAAPDGDDPAAAPCLRMRAGFRYGDEVVAADEPIAVLGPPTGPFWLRDEDEEGRLVAALAAMGYEPAETFCEEDAVDFVRRVLPRLLDAGWEALGEDVARRYRVARRRVRTRVAVRSEVDWFEVKAEVAVGAEVLPWPSLVAALAAGRRYVRLGSGALAELPERWLRRQIALLAAIKAAPTDLASGVRVARCQAPLAEALAEGADDARLDDGFRAFAAKLKGFGGIAEVAPPAGFTGELRPYQARGLAYLVFLREHGLHGVLADDMGLGKTVQAAALLLRIHGAGATAGGPGGAGDGAAAERAPSLVVAPTSLLENWRHELARFAPGLRVLVLHGPRRDHAAIAAHDVVVTTYATARLDLEEHRRRTYDTVILDEAQAIKNPASQTAQALSRLAARHRLALTGTPIENHLLELWSLFRFLMPGLLGEEAAFRARYAAPIAAGDAAARAELKARVAPFLLRRLKADVAPELPPRSDLVLWCELDPAQRRAYDALLAASRARVEAAVASQGLAGSRITVLDALLKLRQACCHPALLKLPETATLGSGKLDAFLELVDELVAGGHRALVFSQFTAMLALLKAALAARGVAFEYLDGQTRDRAACVRRFDEGEAPLFLISLKAGGTGLNLVAADYVVHYDPWWNPAVEDQATDRAHRIGQTRPVFSYKLIAKGTIEEKLLALQASKRELVRDLLAADGVGKQLTAADLAFLFEAPAPAGSSGGA